MFFWLAKQVTRGPVPAAVVCGVGALLTFMMPLLVVVHMMCFALAVLRLPLDQRRQFIGMAAAIAVGLSLLLGGVPGVAAMGVSLAIYWGGVGVAAEVLRRTVSLSSAVAVVGMLGVALAVAGLLITGGDPQAFWYRVLTDYVNIGALLAQMGPIPEQDLEAITRAVASSMNFAMVATLTSLWLIALLWARSQQARLFNPGGFREAFHQLRLGRPVTIACAVALFAGVLAMSGWVGGFYAVAVVIMVVQGLAVIHGIAAIRGWPVWVLVILYLILLLPQTGAFLGLAVIGVLDYWVDFRRRVAARAGGSVDPGDRDEH